MNIKRNIIFALESRKKNGVPIVENVPIRMRVIYASQRIEFTTGYRIDVAKWDADKQRVKNGCTNKLKQSASEINADLLKYYAEMQNVFKEFEVQETIPTTQQLKDAFNLRMKDSSGEQQEEVQISFWEVFDEFVKECGNQNNWTASTYEKFAAVRNHIKEFKEDVTFEYFNEFGLNEYVNFLRDRKDMRNSTIGKQMGFLKWFLRWSFKKGHHQNIAYDAFKPKLKTTPKKVIFLTWDELNKLKDYQIPHDKQYLERVRDVFLFCCFTSLRYSDVRNLKRSDIKPDHIEVTTVKTADSLIIELNDHSKAILEKYKDVHFESHMALPVISNQKMNDYLKELGELAEINEPVRETYYKGNERIDEVTPKYALLSTHAGRKTFICNALALGIPAPVVMKCWGITPLQIFLHKDEGHWLGGKPDTEDKESFQVGGKWFKPNYHAHIVFDWMNHDTGKSRKLNDEDMAAMQTLASDILMMERGQSKNVTGKEHLERNDFIIEKQKAELQRIEAIKRHKEQQVNLAEQELRQVKSEIRTDKLKSVATDAATVIASGVGSLFGSGKMKKLEQSNDELRQEIAKRDKGIDDLKAQMQRMQEQHGKQIRNLQGIHNQELEAKDKEISRLNTLLEKAFKWFPMLREMLRMEKLCAAIGFTKEMIESLLTKKEAIRCNGRIYSEEHRRKFDIKNDIFKVEKNPTDDSKLILTINKQSIDEWFKEQWNKLRQSLRQSAEEPRKNRGFKL